MSPRIGPDPNSPAMIAFVWGGPGQPTVEDVTVPDEDLPSEFPREDEWQSAAGTVEAIAEILDRANVPRPEHYDPEIDIR